MIVRLHYADGKTEDHELKNGVHFADYIRASTCPGSKLAFKLAGPAGPLPDRRARRRSRPIAQHRAGQGPRPLGARSSWR